MAIDFKTFVSVAPHVLAVKKPLMLRGRHGVGKSELVYQVASEMGLSVVERRASQMTEGDLVGLPRTDGDVTSFCPPDWLDECCNHARVLFLDEVDRAIPEVRQGIFELTDSRKIFDYEPNKVYPSRRSWVRLDDCLNAAGMLGEEHNPAVFHLATGFVGFEAAVSFNDFVKNYERQVTVEMILDEGQVDKTTSFNINEHCALIEKLEASTVFNGELTDDQCKNLANYFVSLPSEAVMKLWQALGNGNVENVTRFHKAQADSGETVGNKLVTILTGK